ncbi:hypothetical protein Y032_0014g2511 [Ancylostoma ceylanicum]|uniref:Uncharacterized protein n=1 Tax=Ancylostoma ceylanicum TaxID=53326 RepID=A0A016VCK0_9BILA|nr:hypothetical protein Y032_0014g2511 [Ancylostoma ceylanicum]
MGLFSKREAIIVDYYVDGTNSDCFLSFQLSMFQTKCCKYIAQRWLQRKDGGASRLIDYYHRQSFYLRNRTKTAIDGGTNSNTWRSLAILLKELDFAALKTTALHMRKILKTGGIVDTGFTTLQINFQALKAPANPSLRPDRGYGVTSLLQILCLS